MRYVGLFISILTFSMLSGCTTLYVPTTNQTPMMKEKGEIHAAAHLGVNGVSLDGGYAITEKYGIVGQISGRVDENSEGEEVGRHSYGEIGINYFDLGSNNIRGELIAGLGGGTSERQDKESDFIKPFIQMNGGFTSRVFDLGFSARTGYVSFPDLESDNNYNTSALFFEPAAFARIGYQNVKLESQLGLAWPLGVEDLEFGFEPLRFSLGLKLVFNSGD